MHEQTLSDYELPPELEGLQVDVQAATLALQSIGMPPRGTLAPAMVAAAGDCLIVANLARSLPAGSDFAAAVRILRSIAAEQPLPILQLQLQLLVSLASAMAGAEADALAPAPDTVRERMLWLSDLVDARVRNAQHDIGVTS